MAVNYMFKTRYMYKISKNNIGKTISIYFGIHVKFMRKKDDGDYNTILFDN